MSKLYGSVTSNNKTARTTTASKEVAAYVQTELGRVTVTLSANGDYAVFIAPVEQYNAVTSREVLAAAGNVNDEGYYVNHL